VSGRSDGAENKAVRLTHLLKKLPPRWVPVLISLLLSLTLPLWPLHALLSLVSARRESLAYMNALLLLLLALGNALGGVAYYILLSWGVMLSFLYLSLAFSPSSLILLGHLLASAAVRYHPTLTVAALAIPTVFFLFFASLLNKPSLLFLGMPLPKLLSAFMRSWLLGERELEEQLERFATTTRVEAFRVVLRDKEDQLELVVPNIHFGPFGELGSSAFPAMVAKARNAVVLHGTANHQLDFVRREEAKALVESLTGKKVAESRLGRWREGKAGKAKALLLDLGSFSLSFLSRAPHTTEDITYGGGLKIRALFPNTVVVDLHNSSASNITYFDELSPEVEEYVKAVEKAHAKAGRGSSVYFSYAFLPSSASSVGGAGIRVVGIHAGRPVALVVVDSNGIKRECRERIERIGRELGLPTVVATTDTHERNVREGVVNDYACEDAERLREALEKVKEGLEEKRRRGLKAEVALYKVTFPAKVVGSRKVVETLSVILDSYAIARALLPFLLIVDGVLIYIVSLI